MSDWKAAESREHRDFLYIEEANANDGSSRRLNSIPTSQTVKTLKQSIAADLGNPQGWNSLALAFAGQELSDLNRNLAHYGIEDGDTIFFTRTVTPQVPRDDNPPPYSGARTLNNVMFRNVDGKTLALHGIPLSWKVKQLRKKLGEEKALEIEYYRFIWSGKQLEDDRTLEEYGLLESCTIHMVMSLPGGRC